MFWRSCKEPLKKDDQEIQLREYLCTQSIQYTHIFAKPQYPQYNTREFVLYVSLLISLGNAPSVISEHSQVKSAAQAPQNWTQNEKQEALVN